MSRQQYATPTRPTEEEAEYLDFYTLVQRGYFRTPMTTPDKPARPKLSSTTPTRDEMLAYENAQGEYGEAYRAWEEARTAVGADQARLDALFYKGVAQDLGYDPDNEFAKALVAKAYDDGHYAGMSEVYGQMQGLMSLYELHMKLMAAK